jgi:hypothetical protein
LRALQDLVAMAGRQPVPPQAYRGNVQASPADEGNPQLDVAFTGAWRDGIEVLRLGPYTVLQRNDRQIAQHASGPWTRLQGDEPEAPLTPWRLLREVGNGVVTKVTPAAHDDRPASLVHVVWQGKAAGALVDAANTPSPRWQVLLEGIGRLTNRDPSPTGPAVVDATLLYDPAQQHLYRATVRFAALAPLPDVAELGGDAAPAAGTEGHEVGAADAAGLPPLPRPAVVQFRIELQPIPWESVPWPTLSPAAQALLHGGEPPR